MGRLKVSNHCSSGFSAQLTLEIPYADTVKLVQLVDQIPLLLVGYIYALLLVGHVGQIAVLGLGVRDKGLFEVGVVFLAFVDQIVDEGLSGQFSELHTCNAFLR